jgi:cytochrome c oxidase cbb3-type subunit 3
MAAYEEEQKKVLARGATVDDSAIVTLAQDPAAIAEGKRIFVDNCAQCHKADASGDIGPNLTDEFWLHGGSAGNIYTVVYEGVLDKGMLAWGSTLGPGGVKQVSAYVLTLRNTNVAGKAPQGEKWTPPPAGSGAPANAPPSGG